MNVVELDVSDGRVTFAGLSLPLPPQSPFDDATRDVILGIRPTDLRHASDAPRATRGSACDPTWSRSSEVSRTRSSDQRARVQTDAARAAIECVR